MPPSRAASDGPHVLTTGAAAEPRAANSAAASSGPSLEARERCTTGWPCSSGGNGGPGGACSSERQVVRAAPNAGSAPAHAPATAASSAAGQSR